MGIIAFRFIRLGVAVWVGTWLAAAVKAETEVQIDPKLQAQVQQWIAQASQEKEASGEAFKAISEIPEAALPLLDRELEKEVFPESVRKQLEIAIRKFRQNCYQRRITQNNKMVENWEHKTGLEAYQKVGVHDPKWEGPAIRFLTAWEAAQDWQDIWEKGQKAKAAQCGDPLVKYLAVKTGCILGYLEDAEKTEQLSEMAEGMKQSAYGPGRKILCYLAYLESIENLHDQPPEIQARYHAFLQSAVELFPESLKEEPSPEQTYNIMNRLMVAKRQESEENPDQGKLAIEELIPQFEKAMPNHPATLLVKAQAYLLWGMDGRTSCLRPDVTPEGQLLWEERFAVAEDLLKQVMVLDPMNYMAPTSMIDIQLCRENSREQMEFWFQRAIDNNPNNRKAYDAKLNYLLPQWYGNQEEVMAFAHDCVATGNYEAEIPLVMVAAHQYMRQWDRSKWYFFKPDVWKDLSEVYAAYLAKYPKDTRIRSWYVMYAYWSAHWTVAQEQMQILGTHYSLEAFKTREKYEHLKAEIEKKSKMVAPRNAPAK